MNKKSIDINVGAAAVPGTDIAGGIGNAGTGMGPGMMPATEAPGMGFGTGTGMMPEAGTGMIPSMGTGMTPTAGAGMMPSTMPGMGMNYMQNPMMQNPMMYQPSGMCCPYLMNMQCPMMYGQQYGLGAAGYPNMMNPYMNNTYLPMNGMQY